MTARHHSTASEPNTASAFLFAPAIASASGAIASCTWMALADRLRPADSLVVFIVLGIGFAVVGYATALVVGVPIYLLVPVAVRGHGPAVMLLGGLVAALPWTIAGVLSRDGGVLLVAAGAFGLGCVGGCAFALIRRPSPVPREPARPDLPEA